MPSSARTCVRFYPDLAALVPDFVESEILDPRIHMF